MDWNTPEATQRAAGLAPSVAEDPQVVESFARMMRNSISPGDAKQASTFVREIDVRPVLPLVDVPTLVMHHEGDQVKLLSEAEYLASHIPGARLVVLPGDGSHLLAL